MAVMPIIPIFLCVFTVVFILIAALAILTQTGVLNRRLAGILGLVIILPVVCGIFIMVIVSFTTISGSSIGM